MIKIVLIVGSLILAVYSVIAFNTFKLGYKAMHAPLNEVAKHADDLQQLELYNTNGEAYTVYIPK